MKELMIIDFVGKTRTHLIDAESQFQIETTLRQLAREFLGGKLYLSSNVDDDTPLAERKCIELNHAGWLGTEIRAEVAARSQSKDRWLTPVLQQQFGHNLPSIQHASLYFVSGDYDVKRRNDGKEIFIDASERSLVKRGGDTVFGNRLAIKWLIADGSDIPLSEICISVMKALFANDLFDYGYCCHADEFNAKNIDLTKGVQTIGLDVSKCLPGFYWGNYFGKFLCGHIGIERLVAVPGCRSHALEHGVLVTNCLSPEFWNRADYLSNAKEAITGIGASMFFEKDTPPQGSLFS